MAHSTTFANAPAGSWLEVNDGTLNNTLISSESARDVHVHVGDTVPDANSAYHVCRYGAPFSSSLASKVYVRSSQSYALKVTVTKG